MLHGGLQRRRQGGHQALPRGLHRLRQALQRGGLEEEPCPVAVPNHDPAPKAEVGAAQARSRAQRLHVAPRRRGGAAGGVVERAQACGQAVDLQQGRVIGAFGCSTKRVDDSCHQAGGAAAPELTSWPRTGTDCRATGASRPAPTPHPTKAPAPVLPTRSSTGDLDMAPAGGRRRRQAPAAAALRCVQSTAADCRVERCESGELPDLIREAGEAATGGVARGGCALDSAGRSAVRQQLRRLHEVTQSRRGGARTTGGRPPGWRAR